MMQKTTFKLGMVAAAMVLAVGSAQAASMRWAGANDILTIDPHAQNHQTTHAFLQQIYESLVRYDGKYNTDPELATKWTQISSTQVRFENSNNKYYVLNNQPYFSGKGLASQLQKITEGGQTGWRLLSSDPNNYGDIGDRAIDLSYSPNPSSLRGATGYSSTCMGYNTQASGSASTATGEGTTASGTNSTAMGYYTIASGYVSTSIGSGTQASGSNSIAMGLSTQASGINSTTMGTGTTAKSYSSLAIGQYNDTIVRSNPQDLAADPTVILLGLAAIIPAHLFSLLLPRPSVTGRGKHPFFATLGWKLGNFRWWYFPVVVAGFFGIAMLVTSVFPEQDNDIIRILRSSPYAAYALAALATIFAPLVEEVVYRGVLYSAFQRSIGAPLAVTVVTLLFAGIHYAQYWGSPGTIILITLLSLILTLTRAISGNLLPCVILHFLFNGLQSVGIIATMTDTNAEASFFHFLK